VKPALYNFCRNYATLKMAPAMAAKVTGESWCLDRLIGETADTAETATSEAGSLHGCDSKCDRMRLPRLRIWPVMLAVAVVAIGSASCVWGAKSRRLSAIAAQCEAEEAEFRQALAIEIEHKKGWGGVVTNIKAKIADAIDQHNNDNNRAELARARRVVAGINQRIQQYREFADSARASAVVYRRAARYPWLSAPTVPSESE
jgi:hypothetical protein